MSSSWFPSSLLFCLLKREVRSMLPDQSDARTRHAEYLLSTRTGADFLLIHSGCEWMIHSQWIIGTSQVFQDLLFPSGVRPSKHQCLPRNNSASKVRDPNITRQQWDASFEPVLFDRFVEHVYRGTYTLDDGGKLSQLHHTTRVPPGVHPAAYRHPSGRHPCLAHFEMYALAERLQYPELMTTALAKFHETAVGDRLLDPQFVFDFVQALWDPNVRFIVDRDGRLKRYMVHLVVAWQHKFWTIRERNDFVNLVAGPEFDRFKAELLDCRMDNGQMLMQNPYENEAWKSRRSERRRGVGTTVRWLLNSTGEDEEEIVDAEDDD
ncbi:hypothetical protein BS50DRAFT_635712 [Corynespora cassiicola Philippines]|uniref:BTB domain-containing protein n=1 Tax=Corynespora cassiicola Philippines TaxID=1448308 RepID=A0A2T2NHG2_CORCC|nr:hypothetical protein BS50DRAFT_635712 [Corynespora cassiicola Philippines]